MNTLKNLIESFPTIFRDAVREDEAQLELLESRLHVSLPNDLRWFWLNCGSGLSGAAPNAGESIELTILYRAAVGLPSYYIVLEDRNDGGSVLINTSLPNGPVTWIDAHAINKVANGNLLATEHDYFPDFGAWVAYCIEDINNDGP